MSVIRIESKNGAEIEDGDWGRMRVWDQKCDREEIENEVGIENDNVHAGAAAGINYMVKLPTRKCKTFCLRPFGARPSAVADVMTPPSAHWEADNRVLRSRRPYCTQKY
ncbi:hypothetical protein EVAR_97364_1 [Eumeta japonica]|uniref:Uncharacterized protein n=1 Tax=Eumeta variegata TaxID=151549 RepID=A0A4C1YY39_EUMVA|nr:hypothetical protein EVAR_97364_1 [Eumeta japonica]